MMKAGEKGKIVMMRRRPSDVTMLSIAWRLIFGLFGVHNFYTGRKVRGWISLGFMIAFLVGAIILISLDRTEDVWAQPVALLSTPALVMWIADAFAIVFGWYRYPVRLGDSKRDA